MVAIRLDYPQVDGKAVHRARLVEELADPHLRVALVTGGPASGKTVTVAQWYEKLVGVTRTWLTLESADDHPARFWRRLAIGLRLAVPDGFVGTNKLAADPHTPTGPILDQMQVELSDLEEELVVVLDDVHVLHESQIWVDLVALVERFPRHVRLVLTSRVDPPIPMARWSAHSWFIEIRQADLAFTLPETKGFFAALDEHRLTSGDIEALWDHTEGWAAGLHLAAVHIRHRADASEAARKFSGHHRMVIDLLTTEILDTQPEAIIDFLLRTCVLDVLDAETCDALTDRTDSAEVLRSLVTHIPFVQALDTDGEFYRFHSLMRDTLRSQLRARRPGASQTLAHIAAGVVEQRGEIVSSMSLNIAAGDTDRAVSLAFQAASDWHHCTPGDSNVMQWVELLRPDDSASIDSVLAYAISLSMADRSDEGLVWLDRAALRIASDPPSYVREAAFIDAFRLTAFAVMTGTGEGIESGQRVIAQVEAGADFGYPCTRIRPNLVRAHLLTDQPREAERVVGAGPMGDEAAQVLLGPAVAARVALRLGELTKAEDLTAHAFAAARSLGMDKEFGSVDAHLAHLGLLIERNRLSEADAAARLLRAICDSHPQAVVYQVLARADQLRLFVARNGPAEAFPLIDEMRALIAGRQRPALEHLIDGIAARWRIEVGDLCRAGELISRLPSDRHQTILLAARLDLANQRPHDAMARVSQLDFGNRQDRLASELLRARAALAMADQSVHTYISSAVELAAPEGFIRLILEEGSVVSRLARAAAEKLDTDAGIQLAADLGAPRRTRQEKLLPAPLTDRERAVLRLLPTRLTNQEIGGECYMSVNTVKTHVKNIYAKLGASSRSVAVEQARLMEIL